MPKSLLGKAVGYWLNQEERLSVFLDHPEVEIDNNGLEREIRSIAVGRKNWLFVSVRQTPWCLAGYGARTERVVEALRRAG